MITVTGKTVVGLGGAGGWEALGWATEEVAQSGGRLTLLHVCAAGSAPDRAVGEPTLDDTANVDPGLAQAYAKARRTLGAGHVSLCIRDGDPTTRLVAASMGARMLVIGAGEGGRTVRRVLRHALCPVVVARPITQPAWSTPLAGHVVVGVDGTHAGQAAVEFAFTYAAGHHLPLAAVHVSRTSHDDYFYDDTTLSTHFAVEPAALELLAAETEAWELKWPRLPVRRAVLHGPVAETLIRAGSGARVLVIGDERRGVIGRARTGDLPLTVATEAPCPVAVIPQNSVPSPSPRP